MSACTQTQTQAQAQTQAQTQAQAQAQAQTQIRTRTLTNFNVDRAPTLTRALRLPLTQVNMDRELGLLDNMVSRP